MGRRLGTLIVLALALAGCGKEHPADKVTYVADDDPRMIAAMEKARSTVSTFIAALKSPKPGHSAFSVKSAFTDGDTAEHMWLSPVSYDGNSFHGTVNNKPERVKTVMMGDKVTVAPSKRGFGKLNRLERVCIGMVSWRLGMT